MKRKPDRLDLIAQLVVAAIVFLAMPFCRSPICGAEHPLLLCVGLENLVPRVGKFHVFCTRQG